MISCSTRSAWLPMAGGAASASCRSTRRGPFRSSLTELAESRGRFLREAMANPGAMAALAVGPDAIAELSEPWKASSPSTGTDPSRVVSGHVPR